MLRILKSVYGKMRPRGIAAEEKAGAKEEGGRVSNTVIRAPRRWSWWFGLGGGESSKRWEGKRREGEESRQQQSWATLWVRREEGLCLQAVESVKDANQDTSWGALGFRGRIPMAMQLADCTAARAKLVSYLTRWR